MVDEALAAKVSEAALAGLQEGYGMARKMERYAKLDEVRKNAVQVLTAEDPSLKGKVLEIIESLERRILREMILKENRRIDGRSTTRDPSDQLRGRAPAPRARFGPLQPGRDAGAGDRDPGDLPRRAADGLHRRRGEALLPAPLQFPALLASARPSRSGARAGGRSATAACPARALLPVLPSKEAFPYTIRVVSDILSSNGSSSMATVCGGCLSLMDAGVPIRDTVAGIAMGLLKEGDQVVILSDILGDEDHAGDMDFKVCGTEKGVTSLQMDIKIDNLTGDILRKALSQAREGRVFIIGKLRETLAAPKPDISAYAPRITTVKVRPEKVRDVIGSGGKNIRQIVAETGVEINVEDDGTVTIASSDAEAAARAVAMVKWLTEDAEVGKIYNGTVKKIVDFGAFVEILPGTEGLLHISQLAKERVNKVTDILQEGDEVRVKVLEVDKQGKIRLSRKEALAENGQ